jgi:nanoRNase/pAp phosphatase (c-di-AMP/oligoRNAs hydrolase)
VIHHASLRRDIDSLLQRHRGERHVVVLQDYPDPDALGSALAHQLVSASFGIDTDVAFAGEVSHHQNRRLVDWLNLRLHHPRDGFRVEGAHGAVFVDNQGSTCPYIVRLLERAEIPPVLIIDHHDAESRLEPELEVLETVGATSTLYAELFQQGALPLAPETDAGGRLASGLLIGIRTDTQELASATPRDSQAAAWLERYADHDWMEHLGSEPMPWETQEVLARAWVNRVQRDGFLFSGVGYLAALHRDGLPQAAAWLLTQADVHTSVVFGIVRDWRYQETITGSLRTVLPGLAPSEFLRSALETERGPAITRGGRALAGGFEIPVGMSTRASSEEFQEARWAYYEALVLSRLIQSAEGMLRPRPLVTRPPRRRAPASLERRRGHAPHDRWV